MFRTTTTYLQYHNNISSVPQQHMFRTTTTYVPYPIRVLFFPARGRHRLLIDSLYYGFSCPCCNSRTSRSPQYIAAPIFPMPRQPPSPHITVGHGSEQSTTPPSSKPTMLPTGSHSSATRMSCRTSAGCQRHHLIRNPHTRLTGRQSSPSLSTIPSGPSITPATDGTASAHSSRPTIPSTAPMTSMASTLHSADSRTIQERMATHSRITTRTSRKVAERASSTKDLRIKREHSL